MRYYQSSRISGLVFAAMLFFILAACKKEPKPEAPQEKPTREQLTKDSIFLYAKQTYLWNEVLPSYEQFNPRSYTTFQDEINAIKKIKINPATNQPIDKYSFIDDGQVSEELGGAGQDYGFSVRYNNGDPNDLRINYVYENSSAALKGLKRGYQIVKLNNRTDLNGQNQANIDFIIKAVFGSNASVDLTVKKPDGSTEDLTVNRGSYAINPILSNKVFTVGAKKVGYFVFNSFVQIAGDNAAPKALKARLDEMFASFESENISEMIVDLRYNGGGSVNTADYILDYLVPPGKDGVKHVDYFNKTMQNRQATILVNQRFLYQGNWYSYFDIDYSPAEFTDYFKKKGSLNLSRIYFLVGGSTASASELVINSLKPVVNEIVLIGRKTYGKPVGFFPIHIDKYDLYIPQFQTKNRNGEGDYFDGMPVAKEDFDDVSKEFGDPAERYLAYALSHSEKGAFTVSNQARIASLTRPRSQMSAAAFEKMINDLDRRHFKGMIEDKNMLKKK